MYPHILKGDTLSVFAGGKSYIVARSNPDFLDILDAAKAEDLDALIKLVDRPAAVAASLGELGVDGSKVEVLENAVLYNGHPVNNYVVTRILEMRELGMDLKPLTNFLSRLLKNPSFRAVQGLYRFLEASDMPITDDGCFLAYKIVRSDYKDIHSGTFDNSVGAEPRVERNEVDEDPDKTCSYGLHVCSRGYVGNFGGRDSRLMLVKVDPAKVVAVPRDYNDAKMRVTGYDVIDEVKEPVEWTSSVYYTNEDEDYFGHADDEDYIEDEESYDDASAKIVISEDDRKKLIAILSGF